MKEKGLLGRIEDMDEVSRDIYNELGLAEKFILKMTRGSREGPLFSYLGAGALAGSVIMWKYHSPDLTPPMERMAYVLSGCYALMGIGGMVLGYMLKKNNQKNPEQE